MLDAILQGEMDFTKIQLLKNKSAKFYYTILFSLKQEWVFDKSIPTAAVNSRNIYINASWFLNLTVDERIGLLVHEAMHIALCHNIRLQNRHPKLWNVAGDYVINNTLIKSGFSLPKGGCIDKRFEDQNTEQVYNTLYDELPKDPQGNIDTSGIAVPGGDDVIYPNQDDPIEVQRVERETKNLIQKANIVANGADKAPGSLPADIQRIIDRINNPPLPWRTLLNRYLSAFSNQDFSWQKPKRRYLPIYLPGLYSESLGEVTCFIDTSGSITKSYINVCTNGLMDMQRIMQPEKIIVHAFDTKLKQRQVITATDDILKNLKLKGGGGTNIKPVLEWIVENKPSITLIFTDGGFNIPEITVPKTCNIIWLVHNNKEFKIPTGKIIHYTMKESN